MDIGLFESSPSRPVLRYLHPSHSLTLRLLFCKGQPRTFCPCPGKNFSAAIKYDSILPQDLEEQFGHFQAHNESKNIFKAARTPSVFFAVAMCFYVLSGVLGLVGLYPLANLCNLAMGLALLTLVLWAYIR